MNTLAYSDMTPQDASGASTIGSTMQQMSVSFGVATASLVAALFIPDRDHASAVQLIEGIHKAFLLLGGMTILSTGIFLTLKNSDGSAANPNREELAAG